MFRGRFQQGEFVLLAVACTDASNAPVLPDAAPTVNVYGPTGTLILSAKAIPTLDRFGTLGLFAWNLFLDALYPAGHYTVVYDWDASGGAFEGGELDCFEVAAGGDPKGNVLAMYWYARPQANYVMQDLDSRQLIANRNPYL